MENKTYLITKLTGDNYFLWKMRMEMVLQKEKLWSMVIKDPPTTINDEWRTKDQSARATIGLALDDKLLILITDCETAKQTWTKLKVTYEHSNLTNKLFLLKKLYGCRFETYRNMEDYINQIKEIAERLRVIGENIKESHLIAVMLCGLPETYDALVTAIESKEEKEINLEYVSSKLRDEAARKESQSSQNSEQETAMTTHEKPGIGLRKSRIICHRCGKEGHIRRNCDQNIQYRTEGYPRKCENCNDRGNHQSLMTYENEQEKPINLDEEWALSGEETKVSYTGQSWILDSGASAHMSPHREAFNQLLPLQDRITIRMANGESVSANEKGNISLYTGESEENNLVVLKGVLLVPKLKLQLISVKRLCAEGLTVTFNKHECCVLKGSQIIMKGKLVNNVFMIKPSERNDCMTAMSACVHVWHRRLAHRGIQNIKNMANNDLVKNLNIVKCDHDDFCSSCKRGSMTRRTFKPSKSLANKPFHTLVTDLCGPISPSSLGGNRYLLTVTDQYSGFVQVELLKGKYETTQKLINIIRRGYNHFGKYPEIIRSDGGGEYRSQVLEEFLNHNGIIHQTTVPHTPEQNGQAERMNRTLLSEMRSILYGKDLPLELWGEAALTAAYINNLVESTARGKTPFELWYNRSPSVSHLRTFGATAYIHIPKCQRKKLDETSKKGVVVGYGLNKKCYRVWLPGTNKIINGTSVIFNENEQLNYKNDNCSDKINLVEPILSYNDDHNSENQLGTDNGTLRRSDRINFGIPAERLSY